MNEERSQTPSASRADAAPTAPRLPGYEIQSVVGEGSMGRVYRARQLSMDRDVAIKFLPAKLATNEKYARQFIQEARTVARLGHLNIVTGIDVGEHEGNYYFVMEFLDGETIGDVLRRGEKFDERRAVEIARQIASALEHARENGLVHRDVKPDNILMTADGVPKLGDLGLALRADSEQPTKLAGTPQYISPEAVRREEVDTRSDIYSLGVTLLHMISGQMPFQGNAREVIQQHVTTGVPDLRAVAPTASARASILVAGMTAMEPADRYQTPAEVVQAATVFLEQPGKSMPRPAGVQVQVGGRSATVGGRRGVPGAVAACVVIAMVGLGVWWAMSDRADGDREPVASVPGDATPGMQDRGTPEDRGGVTTPDGARTGEANGGTSTARETEAARAYEQARLYQQENPRDFDGVAKRMHAVGERFPGTKYGQKAIDEIAGLDGARAASAREELERVEGEVAELTGRGELGRALQLWRAFPADLKETEPGEQASRLASQLEQRIAKEAAEGAAVALAAVDPASGNEADFSGAMKVLQELRDRLGSTQEAELAAAIGRVRQLQDDHRREVEAALQAEVSKARASLREASGRAEALLQAFDIPGALAVYAALESLPAVASDASLAREVASSSAQVRRLGDVDARVRSELKGLDGERVKYDGKRAILAASGDMLGVRVGRDEEPLDLRLLDQDTLAELATKGVSDGAGLLDAATYLLCAGAFDAAARTAGEAARAGADPGKVTACQERIERARVAALERDAESLWGESVLLLEREKWSQAARLLERLVEEFSGTAFFDLHRFEIEDSLALAQNDGVPPPLIEKILRGKVKIVKASPGAPLIIEVTYDFDTPEQLEDFEQAAFRLPGTGGRGGGGGGGAEPEVETENLWAVEDGQLTGAGNDQLYWRPQIVGDLKLTYEFATPQHKNVGMNLYDGGKGKYWSVILGLDIGAGGGGRGMGSNRNFLIKVDPDAVADYDGPPWQAFLQALKDQSARPEILPGKKYPVQVMVKGEAMLFATGKQKLTVKDADFRTGRISWFARGNEIEIDKLKILAYIDSKWLAEAEEQYRKDREKALEKAAEAEAKGEPGSGDAGDPPDRGE